MVEVEQTLQDLSTHLHDGGVDVLALQEAARRDRGDPECLLAVVEAYGAIQASNLRAFLGGQVWNQIDGLLSRGDIIERRYDEGSPERWIQMPRTPALSAEQRRKVSRLVPLGREYVRRVRELPATQELPALPSARTRGLMLDLPTRSMRLPENFFPRLHFPLSRSDVQPSSGGQAGGFPLWIIPVALAMLLVLAWGVGGGGDSDSTAQLTPTLPPLEPIFAVAPQPRSNSLTVQRDGDGCGTATVVGTGQLGLQLRASADLSSASIGVLNEGQELALRCDEPQEANGLTWWPVRTADGSEGWASSAYLEREDGP